MYNGPRQLLSIRSGPKYFRLGGAVFPKLYMSDDKPMSAPASADEGPSFDTRVLSVSPSNLKLTSNDDCHGTLLEGWSLELAENSEDALNLNAAAHELRASDVPVAFPTETVYGLGADATRSSAVQGIFRAKQRPADNPLIVHVHSLPQLRSILVPQRALQMPGLSEEQFTGDAIHANESNHGAIGQCYEPIPKIYLPLIRRFWPGPLTIILPNPEGSALAREVTAGLTTFGARMPSNKLALALIKLADLPLAAPSANASSKPSPTMAKHVKTDLDGRISTIIDGGQCDVGVESTVVDGLSNPPTILRPGGVSITELQSCPGWEEVTIGYKDSSDAEMKPKAPGMKYKHYSPRATVILYEFWMPAPSLKEIIAHRAKGMSIGIISTKTWRTSESLETANGISHSHLMAEKDINIHLFDSQADNHRVPLQDEQVTKSIARKTRFQIDAFDDALDIWEVSLGHDVSDIARGLFAALRDLDDEEVEAILVEGIDETQGDVASAVMNRLRKAAEVKVDHR